MTKYYKETKELWQLDYDPSGFKWVMADNADQSLYVFERRSVDNHIVVVLNLTPNTYDDYGIGVFGDYMYEEVINSDKDIYNGSNRVNPIPITVNDYPLNGYEHSMRITIAPLAIQIFRPIDRPKKAKTTRKATKK